MKAAKGEATRARVLEEAMTLINIRGYHNTSINDIIDATGVKKGNLYFHFSSKEELGMELVKQAKDDYLKYLAASIRSSRPLDKVNDILSAVYRLHRSRGFMGGCIFGNIALEMSDNNERFAGLIRSVFDDWTGILARFLQDAKDAGDVGKDIKPRALARHIVSSMEGAIMMAKLTKNENEIKNCIETINALLNCSIKKEEIASPEGSQ